MLIELVRRAVARLGVTDIEVDESWAATQPPTTVIGEGVMYLREMPYNFYPTMLRWRLADGSRRLAWLPPEIDRSGPSPRLDGHYMAQRFVTMIRDSAAVTAPAD